LFLHFKPGNLAQREQAAAFGAHRQTLHRVGAVTGFFREANNNGKAAIAFDDGANFLARQCRRDGVVQIACL
jgi:hypothetical protein